MRRVPILMSTATMVGVMVAASAAEKCELPKPDDCLQRGIHLIEGQPADAAGGAGWVAKACESGLAEGCAQLGFMHMTGLGVAQDDAAAYAHSKKACEIGSGLGCNNAAVLTRDSRGVARDNKQIAALAERSCTLEYGSGCYLAAATYDEAVGVKPNPHKSFDFMQKGCDLDDVASCEIVARRRLNGVGGAEKDVAKAAAAFEKTCQLGNAEICNSVGASHYKGNEGFTGGVAKALSFFVKGCELGDAKSCENQKLIEAEAAQSSQAARSGKVEATLGARKGSKATLEVMGEAPPVGSEGEIAKHVETAGFQITLVIGRVKVMKVTGKSVELEILEDKSEAVVDGKKVDHWVPGMALTLDWKAP